MESITLKQYKELSVSRKLVYDPLNSLEPNMMFNGHTFNINDLTWEEVKGVFKTLAKFSDWKHAFDIYETCYKISEDVFWSANIIDYFASKQYLVQTFKKLKDNESRLLRSQDVDEVLWNEAGGQRLDPFSDTLPLMQLGEIYGLYPLDLKTRPYNEIMFLLVAHKNKSEVNSKFDELKRKIKNNG